MTKGLLLKTIRCLIEEGQQVASTKFDAGRGGVQYHGGRPTGVDPRAFAKWQAGCNNLMRLLGDLSAPWKNVFSGNNSHAYTTIMLGTLEAIEQVVNDGLLISIEDMVRADSFSSLLEQADFLDRQGYFLAAGVLGRAVLEEHLRKWASSLPAPIPKSHPTINDFKDALYKDKKITNAVMQHIGAMAAVGNDAAHNKPELTKDSVSGMLRDVREFIGKYP